MRRNIFDVRISLLLFTSIVFTNCNKSSDGLNQVLWNLPLKEMQGFIIGKWKVEYAKGGPSGGIIYPKHNEYIILDSNWIVAGNDTGITLNTPIIWNKERLYGPLDSTYTLNYNIYAVGRSFLMKKIVQEIKNGTLSIIDPNDDAATNYYKRVY